MGYYVLGLSLIKYGPRGPFLDQLRHLNFFGPLGVQGGSPGGSLGGKKGSKGVILDPFNNCSFLLFFSAVNSSFQPKMDNLTKKCIFFNSRGPGGPTRGLQMGPGGLNLG